jgi:hypothetical protein
MIKPVKLDNLYDAEAVAAIVKRYSHIIEHRRGLNSDDQTTRRNYAESMLIVIDAYRRDVPQEIQNLLMRHANLSELEKKARDILK